MPTDAEFIQSFESQQLPLDKWHHADHIRLAYLYLTNHPFDQAAAKIRAGIKAFNNAHAIPDAPTSGYHETMTIAWLRLVELVLHEYGPAEDGEAFVAAHPELSQKKILRLYYSKDRFMSPEAKTSFVEPDLSPLPKSMKHK